jgi:E3 ubiquitin-protein ligase RAD18
MVDLGIPSGGPKALLIRRHTEWVNLVNANYDSSRPRTKRELLQELSVWDRSQGRLLPNGLGHNANESLLMKKDFDCAAWGTAHSEDFQRLIQEARRKRPRNDDKNGEPTLENTCRALTSEVPPDKEISQGREQPRSSEEQKPDGFCPEGFI